MADSGEDDDGDDAAASGHGPRALIGLLLLVGLVVAVLFVVHRLQESAAMQDCLASGRTNCAPIDTNSR
jgi:flagellar biogenesis protein FliO